jgi:ribosomal protein L33
MLCMEFSISNDHSIPTMVALPCYDTLYLYNMHESITYYWCFLCQSAVASSTICNASERFILKKSCPVLNSRIAMITVFLTWIDTFSLYNTHESIAYSWFFPCQFAVASSTIRNASERFILHKSCTVWNFQSPMITVLLPWWLWHVLILYTCTTCMSPSRTIDVSFVRVL